MAESGEQLSSAQRSKIRRLSQPKHPDAGEEAGELNIIPFLDIIMNVLMFVLATVSVTFTATIDTYPPKLGGGGRRSCDSAAAGRLRPAFEPDRGQMGQGD